jgi:hypothetical protein
VGAHLLQEPGRLELARLHCGGARTGLELASGFRDRG